MNVNNKSSMSADQSFIEINKPQATPVSVLDFRPYGKIIGVDITWEEHKAMEKESIDREEERIAGLTEPPPLPWVIRVPYTGDIITNKPLCEILAIVEDNIAQIEDIFINAKIAEEAADAERGFAMPSYYSHPIESIKVSKRNPFDWTIKIQHKMPEIWEGCREDYYENCVKKDDRLYVTIEVRIHSITEKGNADLPGDYYVYINRLWGHSHICWDFRRALTNSFSS
jgi:hypothetical protein